MAEPSLEAFLAAPYTVEVTHRDGTYRLFVPDLGVAASGSDPDGAFAELERRKRTYYETRQALGSTGQIPPPKGERARFDLTPFLIKTAIVALVAVFVISAGGASFSYVLREPLRKTILKTGRAAIDDLREASPITSFSSVLFGAF